jgi:hypothetical protein
MEGRIFKDEGTIKMTSLQPGVFTNKLFYFNMPLGLQLFFTILSP